jgi:hypothetical protein
VHWQVGDQVWTIRFDGGPFGPRYVPERIGVVGRVVPGGFELDSARMPTRFVNAFTPLLFRSEGAAQAVCDAQPRAVPSVEVRA